MAPRMPRVYLIRHGETEWSINGRHTGVSDIPLTQNGETVMKNNAPLITGPGKLIDPKTLTHVIVSPRVRAQKTAELLFEHCKNEFDIKHWETSEEVGEWKYGAFEGLHTHEIQKIRPGWKIWRDGCPSDDKHAGETAEEMQDRVDRVIEKIRNIHREAEDRGCQGKSELSQKERRSLAESADICIVSHGHFSRVFIARWCGFPLAAGTNFSTDPGGLTLLGYQHGTLDEPSVLGVNWFTEPK
ncbi:phosphoglycerate mutase [Phaffia rhodozyma]|uniref:Phosphoglycerate mutase n=1 Tax=Phaffia rhodozyma TaxID=264483 RepID=A0A0F7SWD0_PHARH|nr:phosphoglycerate mutase [Phaffia rhodozyma]